MSTRLLLIVIIGATYLQGATPIIEEPKDIEFHESRPIDDYTKQKIDESFVEEPQEKPKEEETQKETEKPQEKAEEPQNEVIEEPRITVTNEEKELLARLVEAEAGGEPFGGKVAVAVVVFNRVLSPEFPNDVYSVIYQKGQFSPVIDGSINNTPSDDSRKAVEEAIGIINRREEKGAIYFYNPKTAENRWLDTRPTVAEIGNHVFKR